MPAPARTRRRIEAQQLPLAQLLHELRNKEGVPPREAEHQLGESSGVVAIGGVVTIESQGVAEQLLDVARRQRAEHDAMDRTATPFDAGDRLDQGVPPVDFVVAERADQEEERGGLVGHQAREQLE